MRKYIQTLLMYIAIGIAVIPCGILYVISLKYGWGYWLVQVLIIGLGFYLAKITWNKLESLFSKNNESSQKIHYISTSGIVDFNRPPIFFSTNLLEKSPLILKIEYKTSSLDDEFCSKLIKNNIWLTKDNDKLPRVKNTNEIKIEKGDICMNQLIN